MRMKMNLVKCQSRQLVESKSQKKTLKILVFEMEGGGLEHIG